MEFFIFYIFHYVDILYFVYSLIRCGWIQVDFFFLVEIMVYMHIFVWM